MAEDWKDISDDTILNYSGGPNDPAVSDRYQRILQKRSTDAVHALNDKLTGLIKTVDRASQGLKEKTDELLALYDRISKLQSSQQRVLIALSLALVLCTAGYVWINWKSVSAMREANGIQQQLLEIQYRQLGRKTVPNP